MSKSRTNGAEISLTRIFPAIVVGLVIWASGAAAQQSLGDLVAEAGFDWMIGKWVAATDDGTQIQTVYQWQLNKHMISTHVKMGQWEGRGMIYYSPGEDNVVQVGVDNMGGSNKGIWYPDGDKPVVRLDYTQRSGESGKMAIMHSKVDADTMKVSMYGVDESDQLAYEPWATLEYKRQKEQKPKDKVETEP
jgi:hypothetical protein